jgi:uncharacterized protein
MSTHPVSLASRYPRAFVTGASSGLGAAFVARLLAEGVEVWGTARDAARLPVCAGFHPVILDLADGDTAARVFAAAQAEAGGSFDLLINNAGYGVFAPVQAHPFAVWAAQLDAMLTQTIRLAHLALPAMRARGHGAIVNVTSLAVEFPIPGMSGYNAAKAGLSAWSLSLAYELKATGVCVIDFRPGDFRTPFNTAVVQPTGLSETEQTRWDRVWRRFEAMHDAAPLVEVAAVDLVRALQRGRSGVVRTGSFFQAKIAPLLARFSSERLSRAIQARYFDLR